MSKTNIKKNDCGGFSMIELLVSIGMTIVILGVAVASFSGALSTRESESSRTDALTSVQAAINILSREISNSGYGLGTKGTNSNGIVYADSNDKRLRVRSNFVNTYTSSSNTSPDATSSAGEDVTFFYDSASQSVLRYDRNTGITSGIINRVSDVDFEYADYAGSTFTEHLPTPSADTGRVTIKLTVRMPDVRGQPPNQTVVFTTDVTLRNSDYHLAQY